MNRRKDGRMDGKLKNGILNGNKLFFIHAIGTELYLTNMQIYHAEHLDNQHGFSCESVYNGKKTHLRPFDVSKAEIVLFEISMYFNIIVS